MKVFELLKAKLSELKLEDEVVNGLIEYAKAEIPKDFIPKTKYNEKVEELQTVNSKLDETNKTITELKGSNESIEEYKKKLDTLNSELTDFKEKSESRVTRVKIESILKAGLLSSGADPENLDLLMHEYDSKIDEMKLDEAGKDIIGKDDYIKPVKEKRANMFLKSKIVTPDPSKGKGIEDGEFSSIDSAMGL